MNKNYHKDGPTTPKGPFTNCSSSPIHAGRSLREFEEQMAALRKENFNLKLRIYFLEEKPEKPSSSSSTNIPEQANREATYKQIIDLKVSLSLIL
jgi:centrosomin